MTEEGEQNGKISHSFFLDSRYFYLANRAGPRLARPREAKPTPTGGAACPCHGTAHRVVHPRWEGLVPTRWRPRPRAVRSDRAARAAPMPGVAPVCLGGAVCQRASKAAHPRARRPPGTSAPAPPGATPTSRRGVTPKRAQGVAHARPPGLAGAARARVAARGRIRAPVGGGAVAEDRSATGAGLGITRMHGRLRRLAGVARPSRHGGRAPGTPNRRSAARPRPIQRRPGSRLAPPPRVPRAEAAPACVAEPRARAGPLRPPVVEGPRRARPRAVAAPPPGPRPGGPRRGQAEPPGPTAAAPLPAHAAGTRPPCPCSPAVATRRC